MRLVLSGARQRPVSPLRSQKIRNHLAHGLTGRLSIRLKRDPMRARQIECSRNVINRRTLTYFQMGSSVDSVRAPHTRMPRPGNSRMTLARPDHLVLFQILRSELHYVCLNTLRSRGRKCRPCSRAWSAVRTINAETSRHDRRVERQIDRFCDPRSRLSGRLFAQHDFAVVPPSCCRNAALRKPIAPFPYPSPQPSPRLSGERGTAVSTRFQGRRSRSFDAL